MLCSGVPVDGGFGVRAPASVDVDVPANTSIQSVLHPFRVCKPLFILAI